MGEPHTPHFYVFGDLLDVSPSRKANIMYLLETPGYLKTIKKNFPNMFANYGVYKSQNFETPECWHCSKRRAPKIPTICRTTSWKYWIWDPYLSENIKCTFGKSLELWNFETMKPRIFETKKSRNLKSLKPRNQKSRNRETLKLRDPETKRPRNQAFLFP